MGVTRKGTPPFSRPPTHPRSGGRSTTFEDSSLAKTQLLILDDFGLAPLTDSERRDLLEVLEDRYGRRATLVTSQLPVEHWHAVMGDATFADAILDRLVHNAHTITLKGASMRRKKSQTAAVAES